MAAFEELQAKYQQKEQELAELQNAKKDIGKMFDQGLLKVDEDGQYKVVEDQEERVSQSVQQKEPGKYDG